jgi:hypothetical protein
MNRISAGGNLAIEIQPNSWRLTANGADSSRALIEATPGEPVRYMPSFGNTRRLPDTGMLPTQYIQRVVLGWSNEDEAWHLGFLLEPELARPRGSRWCEIVNWPDPNGELFGSTARNAGESLADMMERPFYFVPPRPVEAAAPPTPRPAPLPVLPDTIDLWSVGKTDAGQIELTLATKVRNARRSRAIWYGLLSIIYFALSGLTLTSGIALPRPEFLPYLGLAAGAILLIAAIWSLLTPGYSIDRIVVHPEAKAIRGQRGGRDRWRYESDDLNAIYVTQRMQKPRRNGTQVVPYGELNLRLANGKFKHLLHQGSIELEGVGEQDSAYGDVLEVLKPEATRTGLQALGLHVAQMLDVPCVYDRRRD